VVDEPGDALGQRLDAVEDSMTKDSLLEDGEPAFYLIDPGGMDQGVVEVEPVAVPLSLRRARWGPAGRTGWGRPSACMPVFSSTQSTTEPVDKQTYRAQISATFTRNSGSGL
jgi:hypothetical protein